MYFAVVLRVFSSDIKILNFSSSLSNSKSGIVLKASDSKDFLCKENVGHFRRKCISSSTYMNL